MHGLTLSLQTASLVLQSKDRVDRSHEHTGEAESLWGKMSGRMGDRVSYARPRELEERLEKMRNRVLQDREDDGVLRKGHEKRSVLSTCDNRETCVITSRCTDAADALEFAD